MVYKTGEVKTPINELTAGGGLASRDFRVLAKVLTLPGTLLLSGCTSEQDKFLQKGGFDNYFALPVIENSKIDNNNPLDSAKTISAIYAEKGGDPFLIYEKQGQGGSIQRESYPIHLLYFGTADAIENVVIIAPNDPQTKDETWKSDMNKSQALLTLELKKPVSKETLDNWQTDPNSVDVKKISFWDPLNGQGITVGEESSENPREVAMLLIAPSTARPSEQVSYTPTANVVPTGTPIDALPSPSSLPPAVSVRIKDAIGEQEYNDLSASIGANGEISGNDYTTGKSFEGKIKTETITSKTTADFNFKTIVNAEAIDNKTGQVFTVVWNPETNQWIKVILLSSDSNSYINNIDIAVKSGDFDLILLSQNNNGEPFPDSTPVPKLWVNIAPGLINKSLSYLNISFYPLNKNTNSGWESNHFTENNLPWSIGTSVRGKTSNNKEIVLLTDKIYNPSTGNIFWHFGVDAQSTEASDLNLLIGKGKIIIPVFPLPSDLAPWDPITGIYSYRVYNFQMPVVASMQNPGDIFSLLPIDVQNGIRERMTAGGRFWDKSFLLQDGIPIELARGLSRNILLPGLDQGLIETSSQ